MKNCIIHKAFLVLGEYWKGQVTAGFVSICRKFITVLLFSFLSFNSYAIPMTVDGTDYDITFLLTSYSGNSTLLESQDWWENKSLGTQLTAAYKDSFVSSGLLDPGVEIYFAIRVGTQTPITDVSAHVFDPSQLTDRLITQVEADKVVAYAVAKVAEPSIIALFALGLVGIGFARRRRS